MKTDAGQLFIGVTLWIAGQASTAITSFPGHNIPAEAHAPGPELVVSNQGNIHFDKGTSELNQRLQYGAWLERKNKEMIEDRAVDMAVDTSSGKKSHRRQMRKLCEPVEIPSTDPAPQEEGYVYDPWPSWLKRSSEVALVAIMGSGIAVIGCAIWDMILKGFFKASSPVPEFVALADRVQSEYRLTRNKSLISPLPAEKKSQLKFLSDISWNPMQSTQYKAPLDHFVDNKNLKYILLQKYIKYFRCVKVFKLKIQDKDFTQPQLQVCLKAFCCRRQTDMVTVSTKTTDNTSIPQIGGESQAILCGCWIWKTYTTDVLYCSTVYVVALPHKVFIIYLNLKKCPWCESTRIFSWCMKCLISSFKVVCTILHSFVLKSGDGLNATLFLFPINSHYCCPPPPPPPPCTIHT